MVEAAAETFCNEVNGKENDPPDGFYGYGWADNGLDVVYNITVLGATGLLVTYDVSTAHMQYIVTTCTMDSEQGVGGLLDHGAVVPRMWFAVAINNRTPTAAPRRVWWRGENGTAEGWAGELEICTRWRVRSSSDGVQGYGSGKRMRTGGSSEPPCHSSVQISGMRPGTQCSCAHGMKANQQVASRRRILRSDDDTIY